MNKDVDGQIVAWNDGRTIAVLETENWFYVALNYRDREDEQDRLWVLDPAPFGEYRIATYEERVRFLKELPRECKFSIDKRGRVVNIVFLDQLKHDEQEAEEAMPPFLQEQPAQVQQQQPQATQDATKKNTFERLGLVFLPYLERKKSYGKEFPQFFEDDYEDCNYLQLVIQTMSWFNKAISRRAHAFVLSQEYERSLVKLGAQLNDIDFSELMHGNMSHLYSGLLCINNGSGYNAILWKTDHDANVVNAALLCDCCKIAVIATYNNKGTQKTVLASKRAGDAQSLAYSMFRMLYLFMYAEKNGKVREVDYENSPHAKWLASRNLAPNPLVEYRNSTYYTTINVNTPFSISGHWRNQYCGRDKDGNPIHKRIWIEEHEHSGYHRMAGILKAKDGNV